MKTKGNQHLSYGGHLGILRRMLFRMFSVILIFGCVIFCLKTEVFSILLAPHTSDFITFQLIDKILQNLGLSYHFCQYEIPLINTDLTAQFMIHITTSCILAILFSSPYILVELIVFISPALYKKERYYTLVIAGIIYLLFLVGMLMSYFVLFPISFQFLATYQVDSQIINTITLESYISTFTTLTIMSGIIFQLPVISYILGKFGIVNRALLQKYRNYAFIIIMVIAALITPPDVFSLLLMVIPIYGLYEISILVLR